MKSPLLVVLLALALPASASAAVGEWSRGQRAEARLLAEGVGGDGRLSAGIELRLPEGWTTYWRTPGDAGIAPLIDFSASTNIGPAEVSYPVPTRMDEGAGTITNVYRDRVVLPVTAAVVDPAKPVGLSATIHIGVCHEICVPEDLSLALDVAPGEKDAAAAVLLAEARALVPGPPAPSSFAIASIVRQGGTDNRPVFAFTGTVPDAAEAEVFVEGPADWAAYTPEFQPGAGAAAWTVKFSRTGSVIPIAGAAFRFTIRAGGRAIDQTLRLQ